MLYILSYSYYDAYFSIIVDGPEVAAWQEFCNNLVNDACEKALKDTDKCMYIGWEEIFNQLVSLVVDRGYNVVKPQEANYSGPGIIRSGYYTDEMWTQEQYGLSREMCDKIINHNNNRIKIKHD